MRAYHVSTVLTKEDRQKLVMISAVRLLSTSACLRTMIREEFDRMHPEVKRLASMVPDEQLAMDMEVRDLEDEVCARQN